MQAGSTRGVDAEEAGAVTSESEHAVAGEKNQQRRRCLLDTRLSTLCREAPDE